MVILGAVSAHISVNLLDDYGDYSSGLDRENEKTEYSGGNRFPIRRRADARDALLIGVVAAAIALAIGLYLSRANPVVLALIAFGAVSVFFYNRYLSRLPLVSEPLTAANFALLSAGSYIVVHGSFAHLGTSFLFVFLPAGILLGTLLLVNSVPDRAADGKHGRRSWTVMLGDERRIALFYAISEFFAFAIVISGVLLGRIPLFFTSVLMTLPFAFRVYGGIRNYKDPASFEKCLAENFFGTMIFLFLLVESFLVITPLI